MVHLEEITNMVDNNLEDFYNDRDRFKGFKLLVDFNEAEIPDEPETPDMEFSKPKFRLVRCNWFFFNITYFIIYIFFCFS